ncbi:unnamed protein product [Fusarium equiseti]|uniref:Aminoglycoside phosphotransferase domain-containing protein n=1 Tax=Fusarium equiseti TaxID=61235 RepID=A0A8J2NK40_FUSEQ|nr:unnamed protein product [Fusarium equiseti]
MSDKKYDLQRALTAIDTSDVRYPQNRILERFLELSIDPDASARYLLNRCDVETGSLDLEPLLADWNELVSSYGSQQRSPNKELVGRDLTQELQEHATRPDGPQSYWLVRRSAAIALSQGYIKVEWTKPPKYTVSTILIGGPDRPSILDKMPTIQSYTFKDHSKSGIPLPDSALTKTLTHFMEPIRWNLVAQDVASRHPQPVPITTTVTSFLHQSLSGCTAVLVSTVCRLLPSPLRAQIYLYMCRLGPAGACIDSFTEGEMDTFSRDLQQYLGLIRATAKQVAPAHAICNAIGGPCHDFRISASQPWDEKRGDFFGPFVDEDEFNKTLQTPALPGITHSSGHKIVFTHGDINMRNVMVHKGRISGIIDWENAGWFPNYWEYTKIHYVTKLHKRWLKAMDEVFCEFGDFKSEYATEFQLWEYCF